MSHMDMDFGSSKEQEERVKNLLVTEINQSYQRAQLPAHRISLSKTLKYLKQLVRYSGRIL